MQSVCSKFTDCVLSNGVSGDTLNTLHLQAKKLKPNSVERDLAYYADYFYTGFVSMRGLTHENKTELISQNMMTHTHFLMHQSPTTSYNLALAEQRKPVYSQMNSAIDFSPSVATH